MNLNFGEKFDKGVEKTKEIGKSALKKIPAALAVGLTMLPNSGEAGNNHPAEPEPRVINMNQETFKSPELRSHLDQNMPDGVTRYFVYVENKENPVASVFYLDENKTNISFQTNDMHPQAFSGDINYESLDKQLNNMNEELALAFPGAYKSPSGEIEGVAIEQGQMVGENSYSKWHGFVYITLNGSMEMYRLRDAQNNFQKDEADKLVARAQNEHGSLFQQIPAIWDGEKKLHSTSTSKFEWRAICQTKDGKKFIINSHEKSTQEEFLVMCNELTDGNGNLLVDDLMLVDTGIYSEAVFRDKHQVENDSTFESYPMRDENYPNKQGYTNVVVVAVEK